MNPERKTWLDATAAAAKSAGHIFPEMAACEAGLESADKFGVFGNSLLAREDNNLFGTKQHSHPIYSTVNIPTKEFLKGQWVVVSAEWVKYPDLAACFADRMVTLNRLKNAYPHYANALAAQDYLTYINEVSKSWSTDPARAAKILSIHNMYFPQSS